MARHYNFAITVLLLMASVISPIHANPSDCVKEFADGVFRSQLREHNIAGLTLAVFSGDSIEFTRAYGYSHTEAGRMVDENTGFMVGSISKLFVWVAVMQLVEQNKLDINKPVNQYLNSFRLPDSYKPVTMKHLMTHTPGFEDVLQGLFSKNHTNLPDLETYLSANLPRQIYVPGTTPAYSNYGSALAAYVVEQISGMPFNDYVDQNIFGPLEMKQTTFRQPADFVISENKSRGYVFRQGKLTSPFDEYISCAPAVAVVSSAHDMLIFMKSLLNNEDVPRILNEETIDRMFSQLYTPNSKIPGMGYGFFRLDYKGTNIVWHGGDTYLFHSAFVLLPDHNTGIFLSVNTGENQFNYLDQVTLLIDYLIDPKEESANIKRTNGLNHFTGTYMASKQNVSDHTRIVSLFMRANIKAVPEGLLLSTMGMSPELYRQVDVDVFASGYQKLIFERDEKGKIRRVMLSHLPIMVFKKVPWRESTMLNLLLLLMVFLISVKSIVCPVYHLIKNTKRKNQLFRWIMLPAAALIILFFILFLTTLSSPESVMFDKPSGLNLILLIPLLSVLLVLTTVVFWFKGHTYSKQRFTRTLWQFISFVILVAFFIQMYYWNLLTFPY